MKAIILVAVVAAAAAVPQYDSHARPEEYDPYDPPKYEFEYSVRHAPSVNDYGQQEARDGQSTAGSYEVRLPDTRLQRVVYTVDGDSGFIADVEFDGEARHPEEYGSDHGSTKSTGYSEPLRQGYASVRPETGYGRSESQPETSYRPTLSSPKLSYAPAPSTPKPRYGPAPSSPKTSYGSAPSQPKATYRPVPSPPKTSYRPAPSPSKTTYRPAPSPPKPTYRPAPSPPKTTYRPAPSPSKTSYSPAPSPTKATYRPAPIRPTSPPPKASSTSEPSVYGSKKLQFARVPSDVYDKPLFRVDYERAVSRRGGGQKKKEKTAPARYGPSAVLIGSDDDSYLVPDTPAFQKLLAAPWVSYRKAVDSYLAKEDEAEEGDEAGKVTYGGGRDKSHEESAEITGSSDESSVPYGARISPKSSSGGDDYPSYKTTN